MKFGMWVCLWATALHAVASVAAPTAERGPVKNLDGKVLDPNGIIMENDYLRLALATNKYAGQVMELKYKPTGHELGAFTPQGFCKDRTGEDRFFWKPHRSEGYAGKIVTTTDEHVVAETSYQWNYDYADKKTTFRVSKSYELRREAAVLYVTWRFLNTGNEKVFFTPWVKHLGGRDKALLAGPTVMLNEQGLSMPRDFVKPTTDWMARLSGSETNADLPMVVSIMDYAQIFQQFPWTGGRRYTLETILNRVEVAPGDDWKITYTLGVAPNLGEPLYAAPELAAALEVNGVVEVGKPCSAVVRLAPSLALGEKRLEGEILTADGKSVVKLENREVELIPGRFATAEYTFALPAEGVYNLSLTVYDEQQIYRLGDAVNSQQSSITLPLVVGPAPKTVVKKWQSGGFAWPVRETRVVKPWRTVLSSDALKAGQVLVPGRVYPEDRFDYATTAEPAKIRLARNEYECLQLAVTATNVDDISSLEVEALPLSNADGEKLSEQALKEMLYLTTEVPSGYRSYPVGYWPDPLFRAGWEKRVGDCPFKTQNFAAFKKNGTRVYWLIVKAPKEGIGGLFKGDIVLRLAGKEAGRIAVEVTVDRFAIPTRASFRCSTGLVSFNFPELNSNMEALGLPAEDIPALRKPILDRAQELLLRYGWTPTMWFGPKRQKRYFDYGRGVSMFACPKGTSQAYIDWLKSKDLFKYAFIYAPFDEHPDNEVPEVVKWAKQWKSESEIPILDCFYGKNVEPLFGLVDIWLGQSPEQEWAQARREAGDRFIACNSSLIWFIESELTPGRAQFWDDFMVGYDGRYVYSMVRWTKNVWRKNWTSGNYMGCAVYPGPFTGVATSTRLEAMRDGVEDYDYLTLLRQAVARGKGPNDALEKARDLLAHKEISTAVSTPEGLHAQRNQIADLLTALWVD